MGDKELLELAAKASGIPGSYIRIDDGHNPLEVGIGDLTEGTWWNPLADDGDALRLAVKLRLTIQQTECQCCVGIYADQLDGNGDTPDVSVRCSDDFYDYETTDRHKAVRLAIVRAAAEIGKVKEE